VSAAPGTGARPCGRASPLAPARGRAAKQEARGTVCDGSTKRTLFKWDLTFFFFEGISGT
jgi:hypothetical protein